MAHFTEAQAQSSKLESARKEFTDGNFAYWVLRVSGSDGQYHQFVVIIFHIQIQMLYKVQQVADGLEKCFTIRLRLMPMVP